MIENAMQAQCWDATAVNSGRRSVNPHLKRVSGRTRCEARSIASGHCKAQLGVRTAIRRERLALELHKFMAPVVSAPACAPPPILCRPTSHMQR